MMQYANTIIKVHLNNISNGELTDPLCDNVKRGLTLVRLGLRPTQAKIYLVIF